MVLSNLNFNQSDHQAVALM